MGLIHSIQLIAQCRADSVLTYRIINGTNEIASIEYYYFDENDSVVRTTLAEMQGGLAVPLNEVTIRYFKSGSDFCTESNFKTWNPERGTYRPETRHTRVFSKKGLLLKETYDKISSGIIPETQFTFSYSKSGQVLTSEFMRWNQLQNRWINESKVVHSYNGSLESESITYRWDTLKNAWANDWRVEYSYDSLNALAQTLTYHFKNEAWVPKTRTVYGKDSINPITWNIVQEWNGAKENWTNKYYYIFQHDEQGYTIKEIHLDWVSREWQMNMTLLYEYNEAGMLVQIRNEAGQVMVDRYCRN